MVGLLLVLVFVPVAVWAWAAAVLWAADRILCRLAAARHVLPEDPAEVDPGPPRGPASVEDLLIRSMVLGVFTLLSPCLLVGLASNLSGPGEGVVVVGLILLPWAGVVLITHSVSAGERRWADWGVSAAAGTAFLGVPLSTLALLLWLVWVAS